MGSRPLTDLGLQMIAALPPVLRDSAEYQAVIHAGAREVALLEDAIEQVRAQFNPATADVLLPAWEYQLRLPVGGQGASIQQRRDKVAARLLKNLGASEGREWEQDITAVVGQAWSYEEHVEGDPSSPPANTIRITLPVPPGQSLYAEAQTQIRELTPAHLEIEFASAEGFVLDVSELDVETFGGF